MVYKILWFEFILNLLLFQVIHWPLPKNWLSPKTLTCPLVICLLKNRGYVPSHECPKIWLVSLKKKIVKSNIGWELSLGLNFRFFILTLALNPTLTLKPTPTLILTIFRCKIWDENPMMGKLMIIIVSLNRNCKLHFRFSWSIYWWKNNRFRSIAYTPLVMNSVLWI